MMTLAALILFAAVILSMWLGLEAQSLPVDALIERLLGKRRSSFGLVAVESVPVAHDASEPKAKVVEVWMQRGWRSIQATPAPTLLLTWSKPDYAKMTVKALREACKDRGVRFKARQKKAELVALLG